MNKFKVKWTNSRLNNRNSTKYRRNLTWKRIIRQNYKIRLRNWKMIKKSKFKITNRRKRKIMNQLINYSNWNKI